MIAHSTATPKFLGVRRIWGQHTLLDLLADEHPFIHRSTLRVGLLDHLDLIDLMLGFQVPRDSPWDSLGIPRDSNSFQGIPRANWCRCQLVASEDGFMWLRPLPATRPSIQCSGEDLSRLGVELGLDSIRFALGHANSMGFLEPDMFHLLYLGCSQKQQLRCFRHGKTRQKHIKP